MGLGAGLVLALIASRVIAAMLFGVTHTDTRPTSACSSPRSRW